MNTLQSYVTDFQRLVHDSSNNFWSPTEIIDYANKARKMVAADTGCTRQLQTVNIIAATTLAQATYNMDTFVSSRTVIDVLDVLVLYGNYAFPPLKYLDFDSAKRTGIWQYQSPGTPAVFTIQNKNVYILPWPAVAYPGSTFDLALEPQNLVNLSDNDNDIPFPFTECVAFWMAYLAKLKDQRRDQAEEYRADYTRMILKTLGTKFTRRLK